MNPKTNNKKEYASLVSFPCFTVLTKDNNFSLDFQEEVSILYQKKMISRLIVNLTIVIEYYNFQAKFLELQLRLRHRQA